MRLLEGIMPRVPVGEWFENAIEWITKNLDWLLDAVSKTGTTVNDLLTGILLGIPPAILLLLFVLLSWVVRSWRLAIGVLLSFLLVMSMEQWENAMQTLSIVTLATLTAIIIAVPLGVWAAKNDTVSLVVRPLLDLMQTMPAMVYLIPSVLFFSVGVVPGLFATVIFALPPGVRLTELGIRQVDSETVEAGHSFGASPWEILRGIQVPLAVPSIMAGINQVIMLALSMAVIAGLVGADGLGKEVVASLATLNTGKGIEAGLAIVFLAIFLDRTTAALGDQAKHTGSLLSKYRRWRTAKERNEIA